MTTVDPNPATRAAALNNLIRKSLQKDFDNDITRTPGVSGEISPAFAEGSVEMDPDVWEMWKKVYGL